MTKIGILPTYNPNENRPFLNNFSFVANYPKRIKENGATPVGLLFPLEFDENDLKDIDGFLIPGGTTVRAYHLQAFHYIFTNSKPYIGICMGMQIIGIYNHIKKKIKQNGEELNYQTIKKYFDSSNQNSYLKKISGHNTEDPFYLSSIKPASHKVFLNKNSQLYTIYKNEIITEPSIHSYVLTNIDKDYTISAIDEDGNLEGIEHRQKPIFAVQFHPELEDKNNKLFEFFINLCRRW